MLTGVAYRDELEALRARLAAVEVDRDAARAEVRRLEARLRGGPDAADPIERRLDPAWYSIPGGEPTPVTVKNRSPRKIEVLWLSYEGKERSAGTLVPGGSIRVQTYVGHCWRIVDAASGAVLGHTRVEPGEGEPLIVFEETAEDEDEEDEPATTPTGGPSAPSAPAPPSRRDPPR